MPKAVASSKQERFELKSLPKSEEDEGGFVVLRRMTYGQKLARMDMATQSTLRQQGGSKNVNDAEMDIKMLNRAVAEFEFKHCVVEHNLQNEAGKPLNFSSPQTLDVLDPRVGDEIAQYIGDMNNFDEEDESGN